MDPDFVLNMDPDTDLNPNAQSLHSGYFHETMRSWQSSATQFSADNLIYPIFVSHDDAAREEVSALPLQYRLGINHLEEFLAPIVENGLKTVLLFGTMQEIHKCANASNAVDQVNKVLSAIEILKEKFPKLLVACDVCLCGYTDHGHCGILKSDAKTIDNQRSIDRIAEVALAYVERGCDILAPSDMMDGRIGAIVETLRKYGCRRKVSIMSYSAKFASCFYGPFRDAAGSSPSFGDRSCYQLPTGAKGLALRAAKRDVEEGADILMVKPGMPYLDILQQIKAQHPNYPLAVYQVSGEYAMLYHACAAGAFKLEQALHETMTCMRRAGADIIITYFAPMILKMLKNSEKS